MDAAIPTMIGKLIGLLTTHAPDRLWAEAWPVLVGMGALVLIGRPCALLLQNLITQQGINGNVTSLIRWQSHWQVVRQGLPFFQEDFAGRIANRVMQAGPALRESVVQVINAVWYILVYGTAAVRCWRRPTGGWRCRSPPGSRSMPCCCASWCRGCANARARPRRSAAC